MLVASALTGVFAASQVAAAQTATPAAGPLGNQSSNAGPGEVSPPNAGPAEVSNPTSEPSENIQVKVQRRLLRERNAPSAATQLGANQIAQVGVQGSVSTLLRQAPSVNVYQQGIGPNEPVITIRGLRGIEVAETLDDVPMQDLLNGGAGQYLQNLLGGRFNLDQIGGSTIYAGVAFPDRNTFGTIGGTVAFDSLRPSPDRFIDLTGSVGSFGTWQEGFTANSGKLDGFLGSGYNAPSMMLKYSNLQTKGFIDYTPARYNNMEFAFDKPYEDGLSKFQATVLYNTGSGLVTPEPIPVPYLQQNGMFSNYSPDQEFVHQANDYLTIILKDTTYINDWLSAGLSAFYLESDSDSNFYGNPSIFSAPASGIPGSATVGGAAPFNQTIAGFGGQSDYGPGGLFYQPNVVPYNGAAAYPAGSAGCPTAVFNEWNAAGLQSPCGYNSEYIQQHNDTYGLQPRLTITPSDIFGIRNTITVGALIAKETSPIEPTYYGGLPNVPTTAANEAGTFGGAFDGGVYRIIYQTFAQDKIDFLHNTLHMTPGLTFEGTTSGYSSSTVFGGAPSAATLANPYCQAGNECGYGSYSADKWDREILPFFNIDYDLDRILPMAKGTSIYGSYGESALFAPVTDFSPSTLNQSPPYASIVHAFEGGIRYDTARVALNADIYYQKIDRDFGFFEYQGGPEDGLSLYDNNGQRQFQGQEFSAEWKITPRWDLFGNFSHVRARYLQTALASVTVQEDQFGYGERGTNISGIPQWLATFGVDYDHKGWFLGGDEFHARLEGQYTGRQYTTYDVNGLSNVGSFSNVGIPPFGSYLYYQTTAGATTTNPNGGLEPYLVFNLDLNYSLPVRQLGVPVLKKLDFDLNILNLFNKHYYQYYYNQASPASCGTFGANGAFPGQAESSYSCGGNFNDGLPGEPFAATFTVTARF